MQIGMIGIGLMGNGIARNVMRRGGFPLRFMDHPGNRPTDELLGLGAEARRTAAEVVREADAVILCVTGAPQVEAVLTGPKGVIAALRPGATIIDCSTSLPETSVKMAAMVEAVGGHFLDAPMTRTAQHAYDGTLNLLIGGSAEVLDRMRPVLASFTESVLHVGPTGSGHRMKLLHNYVSIGFMALLAEAAAQAADAGIDATRFVEVLMAGGGGGTALERLAPFILRGDAASLPFTISNATKDLSYYLQMSREAGATHGIADGVHAALVDAEAPEAYLPELIRLLRRQPV